MSYGLRWRLRRLGKNRGLIVPAGCVKDADIAKKHGEYHTHILVWGGS
ncbi:Uncharacterised protein [Escherichia coli]|uniref:Uncharacterized protein n=1 Tax=Escherichia coli TaxID=562 RepID=A0A376KQL0_ECOLX|nr:Uncharacterised protein [Escherichia coli]